MPEEVTKKMVPVAMKMPNFSSNLSSSFFMILVRCFWMMSRLELVILFMAWILSAIASVMGVC